MQMSLNKKVEPSRTQEGSETIMTHPANYKHGQISNIHQEMLADISGAAIWAPAMATPPMASPSRSRRRGRGGVGVTRAK